MATNDAGHEPGDELLPDWSQIPVDDTPEPLGDPHNSEDGDE